MKRPLNTILLAAALLGASSCNSIDDDRIPPVAVYLPFQTQADWEIYGVPGAGSVKTFIKEQREPSNYPYTALSYTGFGGVMLVGSAEGAPVAYDLACPYEAKSSVRITFDSDQMKARCQTCGSVYEILTNYGYPISGPSAEEGYALQRYYVGPGPQGEYMAVTR